MFEEFFYAVFGTPVPAYNTFSQDDRDKSNQLAQELLPEWQDSDYEEESEKSAKTIEYLKLMKELKESKPFIIEMHEIVDGAWLAKYANLQMTKFLINFREEKVFPNATEWWNYVKDTSVLTYSIVRGRSSKLWIWSYQGVSLMVEGNKGYILNANEMEGQIYLNMLGSDILTFTSAIPPINYLGRSEALWKLMGDTPES